eukprot:265089-Chlamydomonas_euryale.AAC.6
MTTPSTKCPTGARQTQGAQLCAPCIRASLLGLLTGPFCVCESLRYIYLSWNAAAAAAAVSAFFSSYWLGQQPTWASDKVKLV